MTDDRLEKVASFLQEYFFAKMKLSEPTSNLEWAQKLLTMLQKHENDLLGKYIDELD